MIIYVCTGMYVCYNKYIHLLSYAKELLESCFESSLIPIFSCSFSPKRKSIDYDNDSHDGSSNRSAKEQKVLLNFLFTFNDRKKKRVKDKRKKNLSVDNLSLSMSFIVNCCFLTIEFLDNLYEDIWHQ